LALTPTDWDRLQDALMVASFWGLDPNRVDRPIERDPQRELAAIFPPSTA
jgi:hypothetical protein